MSGPVAGRIARPHPFSNGRPAPGLRWKSISIRHLLRPAANLDPESVIGEELYNVN